MKKLRRAGERRETKYEKGFSLAEVLMSLGILSFAMIFIAAVFPVGVHFATISTERTIAAAVADEAFAKIRLYTTEPNLPTNIECSFFPVPDYNPWTSGFFVLEFLYPSYDLSDFQNKQYCWAAIWRLLPTDLTGRNVQVTIFVSRKAGATASYYRYSPSTGIDTGNLFPAPVLVEITVSSTEPTEITIDNQEYRTFLTDGCTIVDGVTGAIYRVLRRDDSNPVVIYLDKPFIGSGQRDIWVVPHPVGGGRPPCIAVYQKIIRF